MDNYLKELKNIGLTEYEAKVYYYLMQTTSETAPRLAQLSGVPRTRIYDVLEELSAKGLCQALQSKVKRYRPVNPKFAFAKLMDDLIVDMEAKRNNIQKVTDMLTPLFDTGKKGTEDADFVEVLNEKAKIADKLNSLEKSAKKEILSLVKPPYIVNPNEILERGSLHPKKEKTKYKFLLEHSGEITPEFRTYFEMWKGIGAEIKITQVPLIKLVIFDAKTLAFHVPDSRNKNEQITTLIVDNKIIAGFFRNVFFRYFDEAKTLNQLLEEEK